MWVVLLGVVLIVAAVWLLNYRSGIGWIGALAVAVCGFVLVAVASRAVGYIGAMSSPVLGMTIAALLGAGLLFAALDIAGPAAMAALIGVGAVICIAIAIAGDCSQDLKTGHLVGATPASQQAGEVIGIITAAFTCAAVLFMLNNAYRFVPDDPAVVAQTGGEARETLLAPQANVIAMVLKGVLDTGLPWELVIVGMALALVAECLGIASLPFAIGLYLPLYVTTPIFAGGLLRWLAIGRRKNGKAGHGGVLAASGLVAGGALVEVVLAGFKSSELLSERMGWGKVAPESWLPRLAEWDALAFLGRVMAWRDAAAWHDAVTTLIPFAVLMLFLGLVAWISARRARDHDEGQTPFPSPFPPVTPAGPITPDRPPETPGLGPSPFDKPTAPPEPEGEPPPERGLTPDEPESPPTPDTSADRFAVPPISPPAGPLASQPDTIPLEEDEGKAGSPSEELPEPETIDRIGAPPPGFAPTDSDERDTLESSGDDTRKGTEGHGDAGNEERDKGT
jgi:hypothetical protein